ncbi:MAG TPA: hypothetical protein ENI11_01470 [Actinobacteria bacterium]|nr:hypothetical protein [Actinomycetota bacterium]
MLVAIEISLTLTVGIFTYCLVRQLTLVPQKYARWLQVETRLIRKPRQPKASALLDLTSSWFMGLNVVRDLTNLFANAGLKQPARQMVRLLVSIPIIVIISFIYLRSPIKVVVFLSLAALSVYWWAQRRGDDRIEKFSQQLPLILKHLAGSLSAGMSIQQAVGNAAAQVSEPGRSELQMLDEKLNLGMPLDEALNSMYRRMPLNELNMVIMGLSIQRRVGGNLIKMINLTVEAIEEKRRLVRNLSVQTAQARMSAIVIGVLPFLIIAGLLLMDPQYLAPLFTTSTGLVMLFVAATAETAGFIILKKILDIQT